MNDRGDGVMGEMQLVLSASRNGMYRRTVLIKKREERDGALYTVIQ